MAQLPWRHCPRPAQCILILLHLAVSASLPSPSAEVAEAGSQAQQLLQAINKGYKFKVTMYGSSLEDKRSKLSDVLWCGCHECCQR